MTDTRRHSFGLLALVLFAVTLHTADAVAQRGAPPAAALNGIPTFEPDPKWPVLPAEWQWGQVIGIFADSRGHVWTSSRGYSFLIV